MGSDKVFQPGQQEYAAAAAHYDSVQERELRPACVLYPLSVEDVAVTIKQLSKHAMKFAVTSGGCAPLANAANINGGVTINLQKMNQVLINDDKTIVSIGAGARWLNVYEQLDPLGIAVAGGRVGNVGVGGFTLGGELPRREGLHPNTRVNTPRRRHFKLQWTAWICM